MELRFPSSKTIEEAVKAILVIRTTDLRSSKTLTAVRKVVAARHTTYVAFTRSRRYRRRIFSTPFRNLQKLTCLLQYSVTESRLREMPKLPLISRLNVGRLRPPLSP